MDFEAGTGGLQGSTAGDFDGGYKLSFSRMASVAFKPRHEGHTAANESRDRQSYNPSKQVTPGTKLKKQSQQYVACLVRCAQCQIN